MLKFFLEKYQKSNGGLINSFKTISNDFHFIFFFNFETSKRKIRFLVSPSFVQTLITPCRESLISKRSPILSHLDEKRRGEIRGKIYIEGEGREEGGGGEILAE